MDNVVMSIVNNVFDNIGSAVAVAAADAVAGGPLVRASTTDHTALPGGQMVEKIER